MNHIPVEDCKHGFLYRVSSRNLTYGVYNARSKGFIGIRVKFGHEYLFTEYHYDADEFVGTVHPKEELGPCPYMPQEDNEELFYYLKNFEQSLGENHAHSC